MSISVATKPETFQVEVSAGESWLKLSIHLGEIFTGGQVVRLTPDAKFAVEGRDELSASYGEKNWLSGAASGAFYAFRKLQAPRRVVHVVAFTGRLSSADMEAVGAAVAWAVAGCLHVVMPWDLEGWQGSRVKILPTDTSENGKESATPVAPAIAE